MKNRWRAAPWVGVFIAITYGQSWSQESACPTLVTLKDVISCVMEHHPRVLEGKLAAEKGLLLDDVAKQRPNPSLNSRNLFPASSQANGVNSEIDIAQPIEWGGKRKARRETARAEKNLIETSLRLAQEEVMIETMLDLQRLRQIEAELEVFQETIATYGHIQKQFKRRPQLTPEQQVSTSVFHLAEMDTHFQKSSLLAEQSALFSELEYSLGKKIEFSPSLHTELSTLLKKRLSESKESGSSGLVEQSKASLFLFRSEVERQKSERWPNLTLGPSYDGNALGSTGGNHTVGFNISIGIPVWQRNQAGVIIAEKEAMIAEKTLHWQQRSIETQKKRWKNQYDLALVSLKAAIQKEEIESKHKKVESLYDRGFLPSSLVIEAHRQVLDYTRHQHEQEKLLVEAQYRLYALEGRLLKEML